MKRFLVLMFLLNPVHLYASEIQLIATGSGRALLKVNGTSVVLTQDSPVHENIKLIDANSEETILQIDDKQLILRTDSVAAPILEEEYEPEPTNENPVVLYADNSGFFYVNGFVNQRPVRFLVDTGANTVVFSSTQADRLSINHKKGRLGYASTASGITPMKQLKINRISIEHITLHNVNVTVINGRFPEVPLLGSSFLNQLDMKREGNKMELSKR